METPSIVFENVSFTYPGCEKLSLKNINLTISPGEKIAIVGLNGAGKTTLIKLLFRFYDPDE
jgi:ATP-binding cassette subfamily B protein